MLSVLAFLACQAANDPLAQNFKSPPASARPHTWWHWMDGNATKEGITADLKAMKEVGIGGAQLFTVSQGIPPGPAGYMSDKWRALTTHAVREAGRFGIELCIHNCAGWSSSGGPWIKPADAMQVIAWSTTKVQGPSKFNAELPPIKAPQVYADLPYHKDIAVIAYRTPSEGDRQNASAPDFLGKTGVVRQDGLKVDTSPSPAGLAIAPGDIVTLTARLDAKGRLQWDVPEGQWTILRIGHVPTGKDNHPAPPEGDGLEVDKLSKEALDKHWNGMMAKVLADAGPLAGKVLNNALIDSYEVGSQNWTPKFREEFLKRRGYDPLPYLPVVTGLTIESREKSERFLWDFRRTIADLFADNYFGHFGDLCHRAGLKFSTEPYGNGGFDTIQAGGKSDIPMGEFWIGGAAMETAKVAASVGHVYGRPVVGAESFTADEGRGRWLEEPYAQKALGDWAFCEGINRYIFHRYAQQPWLDLKPGMTMGPWGSHLERTQTWWTEAATWLKYVARCQYLLQSGRFVADAVYYYGEDAPVDLPSRASLRPELPAGYDYDGCDTVALKSMSVKNGRVVLPSGMSYAVLVLPNSTFMTPEVVRKVSQLVMAGATIYGPKPRQSPSLVGYPGCDQQVREIADQVWGPESGKVGRDAVRAPEFDASQARRYGLGQVIRDVPLAEVLSSLKVRPDFEYAPRNFGTKLRYIHRRIGSTETYFVSNQNYRSTKADATFRVRGMVPELWHADTGAIEEAPAYSERDGRTTVPLHLGPAESVFVVFRKPAPKAHFTSFTKVEPANAAQAPRIVIDRARYEAADGRGADVTEKVRQLVQEGEVEIPASNGLFGDPVVNVVKRLVVEFHVGDKARKVTAPENGLIPLVDMPTKNEAPAFEVHRASSGALELTAWKPGAFSFADSAGKSRRLEVKESPRSLNLSDRWGLTFPPKLGAPTKASFPHLISWPSHPNPGIKYFSGSATYAKDIDVPADFLASGRAVRLDLGEVKNFATVTLNGKPVATLWKPPFALDVTTFLKPGKNRLQVKVTNLWPNRLIGDEQLPPDVEWNGTQLKGWPEWMKKGQPRPKTGRVAFTTWRYYDKNSPLLPSGLLGPVTLSSARKVLVAR